MAQHHLSPFGSQADDRLDIILNQYGNVQHAHPLWTSILSFDAARCNLFERSLAQELQKIKCSSQDLEDHEINIYQKAFRILMDQPDTYRGAVHIYIDKILGLSTVGDLYRLYALTPSTTFKSRTQACKLPDFLYGTRITWIPLSPHAAPFKAMHPRPVAGDGDHVGNVKLPDSIEGTYDVDRSKMFTCKLPDFLDGTKITWIPLPPNLAYSKAMYFRPVAGDGDHIRNVKLSDSMESTYDVDRSKMLTCKLPDFLEGTRITWIPLPPNAAHPKAMYPRSATVDGINARDIKLSYSFDDTYDVGGENGKRNAQFISANRPRTSVHNLIIDESKEEKKDDAQLNSANIPRTSVHNLNIPENTEEKKDDAQFNSANTPCTSVHDLNIDESIEEKKDDAQFDSANAPCTSVHKLNIPENTEEKDSENGTRNAQVISANASHTSVQNSNIHADIEKDNAKPDDPKLSQLLETYETALQEFGAADPDTPRHMTTAKFLRDTAENCIHYLQAHGVGIMLKKLTEIRARLAQATEAAEKGMGGKRRRFEYDYSQVPNGPRQDKERKGAKRPKHSHGRTRAESQRGYYDRYIPN
ncbi:MAG: hypothetical protein LQ351_005646 [Letrouitia transgressa]|nr:MAG: hypothetical protein LQ351_005646 [Letrouitia transgressa]